mmetsp:Transcript_54742/g.107098  ORF Transcript_54742/g.107098 Transcript_54742/m.107098 type:complete len:199 (+) Transcript_54742:205-801(+)
MHACAEANPPALNCCRQGRRTNGFGKQILATGAERETIQKTTTLCKTKNVIRVKREKTQPNRERRQIGRRTVNPSHKLSEFFFLLIFLPRPGQLFHFISVFDFSCAWIESALLEIIAFQTGKLGEKTGGNQAADQPARKSHILADALRRKFDRLTECLNCFDPVFSSSLSCTDTTKDLMLRSEAPLETTTIYYCFYYY